MHEHPKLNSISPFFIIKDLQTALEFYHRSLGFEIRLLYPDEEPFFAIVGRDGAQILLKVINEDVEPRPNPSQHPWARWDAFVYVEEPDVLADEYTGRKLDFCEPLKNWDDGLRGFATRDPDGYVIFFGKPL